MGIFLIIFCYCFFVFNNSNLFLFIFLESFDEDDESDLIKSNNLQLSLMNDRPSQLLPESSLLTVPRNDQIGQLSQPGQLGQKSLIFNTINQDIVKLKKMFGKFTLFSDNGMNNPDQWIKMIFTYLNNNYVYPNDIFAYFHSFLDDEFQLWYFKLDANSKTSFEKFIPVFLDQSLKEEIDYYKLVDAEKNAFFDLLKKRTNDKKLLDSITKYPLETYFKKKFLVYSKTMNELSNIKMSKKIILQLADNDLIKKFYNLHNDDIVTILRFAKLEDEKTTT